MIMLDKWHTRSTTRQDNNSSNLDNNNCNKTIHENNIPVTNYTFAALQQHYFTAAASQQLIGSKAADWLQPNLTNNLIILMLSKHKVYRSDMSPK